MGNIAPRKNFLAISLGFLFLAVLFGFTAEAQILSANKSLGIALIVPEISVTELIEVVQEKTVLLENATSGVTASLYFATSSYSEDFTVIASTYSHELAQIIKPAPSGKGFIGNGYDFNLYDASGTQIFSLLIPTVITLEYATSDFVGFDTDTIAPYRWGVHDSAWQAISSFTHDTGARTVTFSTTQLFGSFALFAAPLTPPNAPSGLSATAVLTDQINLLWTDTSSNETGFQIERKTGIGAFAQIATTTANVTSYVNTGLSPQTTYTYRVRAFNAAGSSPYSNEASATTLSGAPPQGGGGGYVPPPTVLPPKPKPEITKEVLIRVDLNGDGKVDLKDLSIMLFYFGKTGPEIAKADLNGDGKVDLIDVSILLYYWKE